MFCFKCGKKNNENSNFCSKCGTDLTIINNKKTKKENNKYSQWDNPTQFEGYDVSKKNEDNKYSQFDDNNQIKPYD